MLVSLSGVFELSSQMELLLDLMLVLEDSADPLLEHVSSHGVVKLMLERLRFKIEFDVIVSIIVLDDVESDTDSSVWDGLGLSREGKLNLVLQDVGVGAKSRDLLSVDLTPAFHDLGNDSFTVFGSHSSLFKIYYN